MRRYYCSLNPFSLQLPHRKRRSRDKITGLLGLFLCGKGSGEMRSSRSSFYGDIAVWPVSWREKRGRAFPCSTQVLGRQRLFVAPGLTLLLAPWAYSVIAGERHKKTSLKLVAFSAASPLQFGGWILLHAQLVPPPGPLQLIYLPSEKSRVWPVATPQHVASQRPDPVLSCAKNKLCSEFHRIKAEIKRPPKNCEKGSFSSGVYRQVSILIS